MANIWRHRTTTEFELPLPNVINHDRTIPARPLTAYAPITAQKNVHGGGEEPSRLAGERMRKNRCRS